MGTPAKSRQEGAKRGNLDEGTPGTSPGDDINVKMHLHTTIPKATMQKIDALSARFGTYSHVIEKAVELLAVRENLPPGLNKAELDQISLWHLMRSEQNMVAVGKTTFLSYINDMPKKALTENNAIEIIEWFHEFKSVSELATEDILIAIQKIWTSANYFREFRIEKKAEGSFRIVVTHDMNDIKYSEFWATYFQVLFSEKLHKAVMILFRPQIFYLEIREK